MQSTRRHKDFAKNQTEAYIEDNFFNQAKLLLIKDRGVWWNLIYFIFHRVLLLRKAIDKYLLA